MAKFSLRVVKFEYEGTVTDGRLEVTASRGYVLQEVNGRRLITCFVCGRTTANPDDIEQRYCGYCGTFHEEQ